MTIMFANPNKQKRYIYTLWQKSAADGRTRTVSQDTLFFEPHSEHGLAAIQNKIKLMQRVEYENRKTTIKNKYAVCVLVEGESAKHWFNGLGVQVDEASAFS